MSDLNKSRPVHSLALGAAIMLAAVAAFSFTPSAAEEARNIPAPAADEQPVLDKETATFAGGCFWGVQGVFQHVNGVLSAKSGYSGGRANTAQYEMVSNGDTGHAEAVQVIFDPKQVSYGRLLQIYFSVAHDPTELDRQGPDTGSQYRSAIFPTSDEQAKVAKAYIGQLNQAHVFDAAIVTRIEPGKPFYAAENYHQDFLTNNPTYPYIVFNDLPKIENLKKMFPRDYRAKPVLVANAGSN
ncbi:methionine sulfoxide reductase A [Rhizobium sp. Root1203]|uniref:peptide-methionine (S)-S-oxide reductase MsrA n=1 Tax=Rhizobium sp. Root1203 TaxID=1736427 RepID=UPI00070CA363|nr:peptide-methionine (S)-S-oxide reductase MsrA [Rhizobium sp. Root1203]KQV12246.1 methionine sulfoxide reductase A [Rhizobium sp. Root1203]